MFGRASSALRRHDGFTLPELLTVMIVIGILAAVAIPVFLGQRDKGNDAAAKSLARLGAGVLEAYHVEHDRYDATRADVVDGLPELRDAPSWGLIADLTSYRLRVRSKSGTTFTIGRPDEAAPMERSCDRPDEAGCPTGGSW